MKELIIILVAGGIVGFVFWCYWLVGSSEMQKADFEEIEPDGFQTDAEKRNDD